MRRMPCASDLGDRGDETSLLDRPPCSDAFLDYACGPRAEAMLSVTLQWWDAPDALRVRSRGPRRRDLPPRSAAVQRRIPRLCLRAEGRGYALGDLAVVGCAGCPARPISGTAETRPPSSIGRRAATHSSTMPAGRGPRLCSR